MSLPLPLEQRKALVRHYLETMWNAQEAEDVHTLQPIEMEEGHSSYTDAVHFFASPPSIYFGDKRLPMPPTQMCQIVRKTFPDFHLFIVDMLGEEEKIVVRWMVQGTDLGGYKDHLPTGKSVNVTGISIFRLEHRSIVEEWIEADVAGMLSQLGFVSNPRPPRITMRRPGNIPHS